jgi:arsenite-transporting ATPase
VHVTVNLAGQPLRLKLWRVQVGRVSLLLLDATEAYHREVARNASNLPEEVRELLPRLRDRNFTRILLVTLPEPTPVHEAADLQRDLRRARIEPWAWVINQSFVRSGTRNPKRTSAGKAGSYRYQGDLL